MSSSCSSVDLGIDADFDDVLTDSLLNDIELFAEHINRLRTSLDTNSYVPDGESKCVQVHAALAMVSQSVRDLLVRYPIFKTAQVLIPASQLVHSVKEINFDNSFIDSASTLQCIEKLEAAVGNTLRHSVHSRPTNQNSQNKNWTLGRKLNKQTSTIDSNNTTSVASTARPPLARRHSEFHAKAPENGKF
uniref:Rho GTPase-activating protein 29/45 N-terminal domain-containing protein n=1 Tax=Acrobeloides nanus TaxID=290746 RepID=A0A914C801_9BILA